MVAYQILFGIHHILIFFFPDQNASPRFSHIHIPHSFVKAWNPLPLLLLRFFRFTTCVQPPQRLLSPSLLHSFISTKSSLSKISNHSLHYTHTRFHIVLHLLSDVIAFTSPHFRYLIPF